MDTGAYIYGGAIAVVVVLAVVLVAVFFVARRRAAAEELARQRATAAANLARTRALTERAAPMAAPDARRDSAPEPSGPTAVSASSVVGTAQEVELAPEGPATEAAPLLPAESPEAAPLRAAQSSEAAPSSPEDAHAPVELWLDSERTAVPEHHEAHSRLRHYADELLGDLKAAKRRAR